MSIEKRFAVIGFGAITEEILRCLAQLGASHSLVGVLVMLVAIAGWALENRAAGQEDLHE